MDFLKNVREISEGTNEAADEQITDESCAHKLHRKVFRFLDCQNCGFKQEML